MRCQKSFCLSCFYSSDYQFLIIIIIIIIELLFSLFCFIRCCRCCCRRCLLVIIVRSSCLKSEENLNHHQHYPRQAVFIVRLYLFLRHVIIRTMFLLLLPSPFHHRNSPVNNNNNSSSNTINELRETLRHLVLPLLNLNNFSAIFVVAVLIYVHVHVNVPFHRIISPMNVIHRLLSRDKRVRVRHRLVRPIIVVRNLEHFLDFLLSFDHLQHSIVEQINWPEKTTTTTKNILSSSSSSFSNFLVLVFVSSLLLPLTMANTSPPTQITTANRIFFVDDIGWNDSSSLPFLLYRKPHWHAGCCSRSNKAALNMCDVTSNNTWNVFERNALIEKSGHIDFLNDETLFCQRYGRFRYLSSKPLAKFTYSIVIIGILFNIFVFLVLIYGSLRRSTSFVLFLALTCFDLLSLASSLFSNLFRTVMPFLNSSAVFCKLFGIFFLYFRQCSSTTLLLIAIERCIVIKYPFCRHTFNKVRLPLLAFIMVIFVVPIPFDCVFFTSGPLHCEAFDTVQADRYQIFRGFLTVFSYAIVPFVGIMISNFLIIMELKKSKERLMGKDENGTLRRISTK